MNTPQHLGYVVVDVDPAGAIHAVGSNILSFRLAHARKRELTGKFPPSRDRRWKVAIVTGRVR